MTPYTHMQPSPHPVAGLQRCRRHHSAPPHSLVVQLTTRAHQNRINTLAQQAVDVKQYFRSWTRDTALTHAIIQTLQHLSLLSRKPPKCHCGADKHLYQSQHFVDGWEYRCSRHGGGTRESIRHDSWIYQKKHPIAHYIIMTRLLDNKSHFQQTRDETTINRNTVRKL